MLKLVKHIKTGRRDIKARRARLVGRASPSPAHPEGAATTGARLGAPGERPASPAGRPRATAGGRPGGGRPRWDSNHRSTCICGVPTYIEVIGGGCRMSNLRNPHVSCHCIYIFPVHFEKALCRMSKEVIFFLMSIALGVPSYVLRKSSVALTF